MLFDEAEMLKDAVALVKILKDAVTVALGVALLPIFLAVAAVALAIDCLNMLFRRPR